MNKEFNNQEKFTNKKIAILSGIIILALLVSCLGTYFITDRLTNEKYSNNSEEEGKTVYNNTKALDDEMMLVLMNEGIIESEQSVSEFKEDNAIANDINEQFIVNFFEANGYDLEELNDSKAVFAKIEKSSVLEPNKYYIGEKDGYFAIYKTDSDGELTIESAEDIYSNSRTVDFLPEEDLNQLKSFEHSYDTKEEAVEKLSAYIS